MRLTDVVARSPNICLCMCRQGIHTIASSDPDGRLVVNAGHTLDQEVLLMLPQVLSGVTVAQQAYPLPKSPHSPYRPQTRSATF